MFVICFINTTEFQQDIPCIFGMGIRYFPMCSTTPCLKIQDFGGRLLWKQDEVGDGRLRPVPPPGELDETQRRS